MKLSRRWDLAITAAVLLCGLILLVSGPSARDVALGAAALVLLVLSWLLFGRRATEGDARSIAFSVAVVIASGLVVAAHPVLAIIQCISYPAVWMLARSTRAAVLFNVAIALSVGVGFLVSVGTTPADLGQTALTVAVSLGFSLAFGFWISRIAGLSEERRDLLENLTAAQTELAVLHRDAGVTSERERLARELHDTIAQSLAGLVLLSQRARRELAADSLGDDTLELIESGARDALAETRSLVAGSAPVDLEAGIAAALTRLAERFERETGIRVTVSADVDRAALGRDAEVVLLRCAQEGLANVRKHAGARTARLDLGVDGDDAVIRVIDDGRGFDPAGASSGFGLAGLRDRLALAGGSIEMDGTAGATTLTARLPVDGVPA
ncbi:MAG TPA: sensor histidine kinase [Pseudolysinimonas sp.]|nr:sensor histidine kinase [Pseudolysinimonas sp.]